MTRQTWTAVVSAFLFVVSAAIIALVPVPFVVRSPGSTQDLLGRVGDKELVAVAGVPTFPTKGQLRYTTVAVTRADASLSLPEALYAHWVDDRKALPRDAVYPAGTSADEVRAREAEQMDTSQEESIAAAVQQAGLTVERVPIVLSVASVGPAADKVNPGDLVLKVDGTPVKAVSEISEIIASHDIGDQVRFTLERDKRVIDLGVETWNSNTRPGEPVVGINFQLGYRYAARVGFDVDSAIGGPSAGLMFSLAIYDKMTPGALVGDRVVAGSGQIDATGRVTAVGAIHEKIAAADRDGATVFVVPEDNCADVGRHPHTIRLVKVRSLTEAVDALDALEDPAREGSVKGCS